MKLTWTKTFANNIYTVQLGVSEITTADTDLFNDFGEPAINFGGVIKNNTDATVVTLPDTFRKIQTQMPVVMRFADANYANNAKAIANAYIFTVEKRINDTMTALRARTDNFSGSQEVII